MHFGGNFLAPLPIVHNKSLQDTPFFVGISLIAILAIWLCAISILLVEWLWYLAWY